MNIISKGKSIAIAPTFLNNGIAYIEHKSSENENSTFSGFTNACKCTWQFEGAMMRRVTVLPAFMKMHSMGFYCGMKTY